MSALADPTTLLGSWSVARTIQDRRAGQRHAVDGVLVIAADGVGGLTWDESLVWHRPGTDATDRDLRVRRGLLLARADDGWWVRFDDGRDFHPWRPGEQVVHPCAPDTYAGRVEGTTARWQVTWEVTGPAKDYTMTTVLTPVDAVQPA